MKGKQSSHRAGLLLQHQTQRQLYHLRTLQFKVGNALTDHKVWIEIIGHWQHHMLKGKQVVSIAHTFGRPRDIDISIDY